MQYNYKEIIPNCVFHPSYPRGGLLMESSNDTQLTNGSSILLKDIMTQEIEIIHPGESIRTAVGIFSKCKQDVLPVVDDDGIMLGVLPSRRLFRALLEGFSLDDQFDTYIVKNPYFINAELTYDELSLVMRVNKSKVGNVPVVDDAGKVVGIAGNKEYLRTSVSLIAKSYALLESIFQAMQEGIITIDKNSYILRANQSIQKLFGIDIKNVQGKHLKDVFPEILCNGIRRVGVRVSIKSASVIVNQIPIMENQELIGMNIVILDISELEEIAHELQIVKNLQTTLSGVLSASSDGVFVTDKLGSVKYVNEMASKLLGSDFDMTTGKSIEKLLHTSSLTQVAKTGISEVDVCRINNRNCIVSNVPIKSDNKNDSQPIGVVSTVYLDDNKLTEEITRKWFSLRQQVQYYRGELEKQGINEMNNFVHIVSENNEFMQIKKETQKIAKSTSTVLMTGESGVGKDMFARAIHAASPRAGKPFIKVNCAAIPETLFESELFGYAPGSFTGASKKGKTGYFEQANQGTIFLDEIGDMPLSIQVKLLQVLQDRQFTRVGGENAEKVDVRIITATNRNLRDAISKGIFREDLYYRLNVIELHLPPLRLRSEDILPLAETFIDKYNAILGTKVSGMSNQVREVLQQYTWPGNIRELENAIERAANYVWEGEIDVEHLPGQILNTEKDVYEPTSYKMVLNDVNKEIIQDALKKAKGNKSAAARILKISRSAFYEKLAKYGIE
jgi:transcriptional regulator with PAS, ATPase and Fis domain